MDSTTKTYFEGLDSKDKNEQYEAYTYIIEITKKPVEWAYEVWDQLRDDLTDEDNHKRSRAAQFLCSLAISDPEKKMLTDFPAVWEVTKDKKFVTARHSLQSTWKVALAGNEQKQMVISCLVDRFDNCVAEKNYTLIRSDIIQGLKNLYDELKEDVIKEVVEELIEKEEDPKYKKKYSTVWRKK